MTGQSRCGKVWVSYRGGVSWASILLVAMISGTLVGPMTRGVSPTPLATDPSPSPYPDATLLAESLLQQGAHFTLVPGSVHARVLNIRNQPLAPDGYVDDDARALGAFADGLTNAGDELPPPNNLLPPNDPARYVAGLGISDGVVLSTCVIDDAAIGDLVPPPLPEGRGVGIQGPNNGLDVYEAYSTNAGEAMVQLQTNRDLDFNDVYARGSGCANQASEFATALEFQVKLGYAETAGGEVPVYPGFLKVTAVVASDVFPAHESSDCATGAVVLVDHQGQFINLLAFRFRPGSGQPAVLEPFRASLLSHTSSGAIGRILMRNATAPVPSELASSAHNSAGADWYDHEFGGFTVPLVRQSGDRPNGNLPEPLAPGIRTVKLVVAGHKVLIPVSTALFVQSHSIEYQRVLPADFNLDGTVDNSDFNIWNANKYTSGRLFTEGDANFDGNVDASDFAIWNAYKYTSGGYRYISADFNDDGVVDLADRAIWEQFEGLANGATRFEGDADGDGDVDADDETIWQAQRP